jgi:hypothetical protein
MWPYLQRPVTSQLNHVENGIRKKVCDSYLIITSNELTNGVTQSFTREQFRSPMELYSYSIKGPLLPRLCQVCLPLPPDVSRNRPVVLAYISLFTSALVDGVVLTYVLATRRITTHVERFPLARFLDKCTVFPVMQYW